MEITSFNDNNSFTLDSIKCNFFPELFHYHSELEISILNEGEGLCFVGDGIVNHEVGNLYFFGSNIFHFFRNKLPLEQEKSERNFNLLCLKFKDDILPSKYVFMQEYKHINELFKKGQYGLVWKQEYILDIKDYMEELKTLTGLDRLSKLYYILNALGEKVHLAEKIASKKVSFSDKAKDDVFKKVIGYICLHFQEKLSLTDLSEYVGMNRTALCRYFKNKIGEPIFAYLLMFRLSYAKKELHNTDLFVSEVAKNSGFNSLSHFAALFSREVGCSPLQYRKQSRLEKK